LFLAGEDHEIVPESVGSSRTLLSHGTILRCGACGLGFRRFRPRPDQLAQLYREADDAMYEAEVENRRRTALRHRRLVEKFAASPGSVLDGGCASGAFLRIMRDAGWKIAGVEPSASQFRRAVCALGEDAMIQQCTLEVARLGAEFDVVTLWDVLEHVTEPREFLQCAASHLKAGGLLVMNVPRIDSIMARLLGRRWPLLLPEHLNYFTLTSLKICGRAAGLQMIHAGQRPATFSLRYCLFRASQHHIPGASIGKNLSERLLLGDLCLPVWLGEAFAVFQKSPESGKG
jgi:SAM-dependent methyltransferase